MAITQTQAQRIEFLVGIDKRSYAGLVNMLKGAFEQRHSLQLKDSDLRELRDQVRGVIQEAGEDLPRSMAVRLDKTGSEIINRMVSVRKQLINAMDAGDEALIESLQEKQSTLRRQLSAELDAHRKRIQDVKGFQESLNIRTLKDAGESMGRSFVGTLDRVKSGDISGLVTTFAGGISKATEKAAGGAQLAAAASSTAAAASALGTAAAGLTIAAAGLSMAGGAIAAVVTLLVAADNQAKDFNRTLLDGAGVADFTFRRMQDGSLDVERQLSASRKAAMQLASEFRGEAKQYAAVLGELNKAGITYAQITKGARTSQEETQLLAEHTRAAVVASKSLGISTSEVATIMKDWSTEFGMDLETIQENFAAISKHAADSSMGTRRFFTAVSQATAGMALYNIRMEEAAGLLAFTSKVLGETDASDFIKSLAKGFAEEGVEERVKRLMIAGPEVASAAAEGAMTRAAKEFSSKFAGSAEVQQAFSDAFGVSITDVDLADTDKLIERMQGMSKEEQASLRQALAAQDSEQAQAASRQLQNIGDLLRAQGKDLGAQTNALAQMDMQGAMAMKLATFGGKRLDEIADNIPMRKAMESLHGLSGKQFDQMRRVENALWDQYNLDVGKEAAAEGGRKEFLKWVAQSDKAARISEQHQEDVEEELDLATQFAKETSESTSSILDLMKNHIVVALEGVHDIMKSFYNAYMGISPTQLAMQEKLIEQSKKEQEATQAEMDGLAVQLQQQHKIMASPEASQIEVLEATAAAERLQQQLDSRTAALESQQAEQKRLESATALTEDPRLVAAKHADSSKFLLGMDYLTSATGLREGAFQDLSKVAEAEGGSALGAHAGLAGNVALHTASAPGREIGTLFKPLWRAMELGKDEKMDEEQTEYLESIRRDMDQSLTLDEQWSKAEDEFRNKYPNTTRDAFLKAMRKFELEQLVGSMGLSGRDAHRAMQDIGAGRNLDRYGGMLKGADAHTLARARGFGIIRGGDDAEDTDSAKPPAQDFISRPGQSPMRFNAGDTLVGMKPGGPIDKALGNGGGIVHININGGNQGEVFRTVKSALKNSGIRS